MAEIRADYKAMEERSRKQAADLEAEQGEHNALAERLAAFRGNVGPSADGASQAPGFFPPPPPASEASTAAPGTSASRAV